MKFLAVLISLVMGVVELCGDVIIHSYRATNLWWHQTQIRFYNWRVEAAKKRVDCLMKKLRGE